MRILPNLYQKSCNYTTTSSVNQQYDTSAAMLTNEKLKTAENTSLQKTDNNTDHVELSDMAKTLLQRSTQKETTDCLDVTKQGNGKYKITFDNTSVISKILQQGYLMIDGQQITLDEHQMKQLNNAGLIMQKSKEAVQNQMFLEQNLISSQQQSDAWKKQAQAQNRAMNTAARMMKGHKVSLEDEKELAKMYPDLYSVVKAVSAMEKIKDSQKDRKISKENAKQREEENMPKDYSMPTADDYPTFSTDVSVEMSSGELQINTVKVTIHPAKNN